MRLAMTYDHMHPSAQLRYYAINKFMQLEKSWGCELDLHMILRPTKEGIRVLLTGRDRAGHALCADSRGLQACAAIDALVERIRSQSSWLKRSRQPQPAHKSLYGASPAKQHTAGRVVSYPTLPVLCHLSDQARHPRHNWADTL